MTSLTAIFGNTREDTSGDSEKLLELYWNRAELKKEFANLREETFRLNDEIKVEKGRTARAEQKLQHLENLLLDPEWMYNVVAHYQFKALNEVCVGKLAAFAEQLKQQREQRQHRELLNAWNNDRLAQARQIEASVGEQRQQIERCEDRLTAERHRFAMMSGFMRFFRRRSMKRLLESIADEIEACQQSESQLLADLAGLKALEAPDTQGLTVTSKRSINFMILAFAQQLYLYFSTDNLAELAKASGDKSVGAVNFGNRTDCEYLLKMLEERKASLPSAGSFADILQQRAKLISEHARFSGDDEAVPMSASVNMLFDFAEDGHVRQEQRSLLGENFWNLSLALCR